VQGVLTAIVALLLYGRMVGLLGAMRGAAFVALTPAMTALLAIPILGEWPSAVDWMASLVTKLIRPNSPKKDFGRRARRSSGFLFALVLPSAFFFVAIGRSKIDGAHWSTRFVRMVHCLYVCLTCAGRCFLAR
jgi:hypothetical protein